MARQHLYSISVGRFFWHIIKPYKWSYFLILLAPIFYGLNSIVTAYIIPLILGVISKETVNWNLVAILVAVFVGYDLFVSVLFFLHEFLTSRILPSIEANSIQLLYDHVQGYNYRFFHTKHQGELQYQFSTLSESFGSFHDQVAYHILTPGIGIIGGILLMFYTSLGMGILALFLVLLFIGTMVSFYLGKKMSTALNQETQAHNKIMAYIGDIFSHIETLFAFRTHYRERQNVHRKIKTELYPAIDRVARLDFSRTAIGVLLYAFIFSSIVCTGVYMAYLGKLEKKLLSSIILIALEFIRTIWQFTYAIAVLIRHLWETHKQLGLLQHKDLSPAKEIKHHDHLPQQHHLNSQDVMISLENIHFRYREEYPLFEGFHLQVKKGEKIGIIGASGSGKSTLIKLILGYFKAEKGSIYIDNKNIDDLSEQEHGQMIALIPQEGYLFNRSLLENIRYGKPEASFEEVIEACKKAEIHAYIEKLPKGYDTLAGEGGSNLSGGERQRITIARAILKDAPILILDEATSSLDPETEHKIQLAWEELLKKHQQTVLVIAHRLSILQNMNRFIIIDQGQIVEEGTHEMLLQKGGFYATFLKKQELYHNV